MIEPDIIQKLRLRYSGLHPLIFHRSVERATTAVELFDILEGFPGKYPVVWDEENHCWTHTTDLARGAEFEVLPIHKAKE